MRTALPKLLAAAMLVAAPMAALAQTGSAAVPGINGPLVLPNGSGTVTYQSSGGTSIGNGVTVFHGTGRSETITFGSSGGAASR